MRRKRLLYNTVTSLMYEATTIICGFILPRFILSAFGSEVNGLTNSITQFLAIISFMELGVGSVVKSSLYKPLAENSVDETSKVIASADQFFRRLAMILAIYVTILSVMYPFFANQNFGFAYTSSLIIIISIRSFAQYYFGIVNRLLITADQRGYIHYIVQTAAVIANTAVCCILIEFNWSIHIVKLATSVIYLLQPFGIYLYVRKNYTINRKIKYEGEPIKQKWNGMAQHVAAVVLNHTDTVVLTMFATMSDVSIYSVYFLVVKGVKQLFLSMTNGIQSLIGELWAKQELKELIKTFAWVEWVIHTGTVYVFGVTAVLIVPFIQVYTKGVNDANYVQPLFAILLTAAHAGHCLRLPYNIVILAGGHYKETQSNYIIAAVINIIISVAIVSKWGLIGVAIGTLAAMLYQTIWMAYYDSRNLIQWPLKYFIKQLFVDCVAVVLIYIAGNMFTMINISYIAWVILAVEVAITALILVAAVNMIFYRDKLSDLTKRCKKRLKRK